jgi:hypothetical protein
MVFVIVRLQVRDHLNGQPHTGVTSTAHQGDCGLMSVEFDAAIAQSMPLLRKPAREARQWNRSS